MSPSDTPEDEKRKPPRRSLVRDMMENMDSAPRKTAPGRAVAPKPGSAPPPSPRKATATRPAGPVPDPRARVRAIREAAKSGAMANADSAPVMEADAASAAVRSPKRTSAFAGFEWSIASRYLRSRRKEGFVSVIAGFSLAGIGLGVAALIIVMAVMTGFREKLVSQIVGVNPHISVVTQSDSFTNYDVLGAAIGNVDGVVRASPLIEGQVLGTTTRGHSGVIVRAMRREDFVQLPLVTAPEKSAGSVENFEGGNGVAIGTRLAAKLGIAVGDSITLISPEGDLTPFGVTPRRKSYPVLYTFQLGRHDFDSAYVYMPLEEAQLYFNKMDSVDSLEVIVEDPNRVEDYVPEVRRAARQSIGVYTWKDLNGSLIGALDVERRVMFIILTLIILVAALNIISGLVMLVKDKGRDIAIMRTMGMARGSILRIFFICGASIGVVGAVAGTVIGVLFCLYISEIQAAVEFITGVNLFPAEVYGLSGLPAKLQFWDVFATLFIALSLSFIATLYPAWRASSLDPVEALRYE